MTDTGRALVLDLAKLLIAAAWADGTVSSEEINALKDLLFRMGEVSGEDWQVLTMYMETPVGEQEVDALLERVLNRIRHDADKALALRFLEEVFCCDGDVVPEEQELLETLKADIAGVRTGVLGSVGRAVRAAMGQRTAAVRASCLRENASRDYIWNTVYYDLSRRQDAGGVTLDRPEAEIRKLCLVAGLLAHVARVDAVVSPAEHEAIQSVFADEWGLAADQAQLFADVACERATRQFDYFRLCQTFFDCTDRDERRRFLAALFRVANAAGKTGSDEIEEIRLIATSLKLSHRDFIDAKLTVARSDRNGL